MLSQGNSEAAMSAISNMAKFLTPPSSSDEGEEKKQTEEDKAAEVGLMLTIRQGSPKEGRQIDRQIQTDGHR